MQKPGTIPEADITDVLAARPPFMGPLILEYPSAAGTLRITADIYGRDDTVEFVLLFDETPDRPICNSADIAIAAILKSLPKTDKSFWAYEDRSVLPHTNTAVYFFRIGVNGKTISRTAAGQLPSNYLYTLINKTP